jgi:hypothetical protein
MKHLITISTKSIGSILLAAVVVPGLLLAQTGTTSTEAPATNTEGAKSTATGEEIKTPVVLPPAKPFKPAPVDGSANGFSDLETVLTAQPNIQDYEAIIKASLKERERRLALLNEALLRLRDAGEIAIAARVQVRIHHLVDLPNPEESDPVLEQMQTLGQQNETLKSEVKELTLKAGKTKPELTSRSR